MVELIRQPDDLSPELDSLVESALTDSDQADVLGHVEDQVEDAPVAAGRKELGSESLGFLEFPLVSESLDEIAD